MKKSNKVTLIGIVVMGIFMVCTRPSVFAQDKKGPNIMAGNTKDVTRPLIKKLGTIRAYLCEATPFVLNGKLYRYEAIRSKYGGGESGRVYSQIVDQATGHIFPPFADGYRFGSAFVEGDMLYVTGTNENAGQRVKIFASKDLEQWDSWTALDLPDFGMWNTSICKGDDEYLMMIEIDKPLEQTGVRFTARFATSKDLKHWEMKPAECVHTKERYSADGSVRYLDGYYYYFYCEAFDRRGATYASEYTRGLRTDVVRSRDLVHWEASPFNPVLISSPELDGKIANAGLTASQRRRIEDATKADICNSDIDFCEYQGKVIINYCWGNQKGQDHVAEAVYEGTMDQFLRGWYPEE